MSGPMDVGTIASLYGTFREYGNGRWRSLLAAIRTDWAAWRYSRALQTRREP